jgi:hypothetical protein
MVASAACVTAGGPEFTAHTPGNARLLRRVAKIVNFHKDFFLREDN